MRRECPWLNDRCQTTHSTMRISVYVKYSARRSLKVRFLQWDNDSGNGRVAHDVLADGALPREPASAAALRTTDNEIGALLVSNATDTFADVLH